MKENVFVRLRTTNDYGDNKGVTNGRYEAVYKLIAGKHVVAYHDGEAKNIIKLDGEKVAIIRKSEAYTTRLTYEKDKMISTPYQTEYGKMDMEIFTNKLILQVGVKSITILLEYDAYLAGQLVSRNMVDIRIDERRI